MCLFMLLGGPKTPRQVGGGFLCPMSSSRQKSHLGLLPAAACLMSASTESDTDRLLMTDFTSLGGHVSAALLGP